MKVPKRQKGDDTDPWEDGSYTIGAYSGFIEVDPEAAKPKPRKGKLGFDLEPKPKPPKKA